MRHNTFFRYIIFIGILLVISILQQCQAVQPESADALEKNLQLAGKNRPELERVLQHYRQRPEDSLKLQAAMILFSNMERDFHYQGKWLEQYDAIFDRMTVRSDEEIQALKDTMLRTAVQTEVTLITHLNHLAADYLIQNIDQAFAAWQEAPWRDSIDFDIFCNYILPYHNFGEKPENWRPILKNRYNHLVKSAVIEPTLEDITCEMNDDLKSWFRFTEQLDDYPGRPSISQLIQGQRGNCSDMAGLAAYCGRAIGIPVAIDFTPQWGNYSAGHVWNALIINKNEQIPFLGAEANPHEYHTLAEGETKIAKVFRRTLIPQENSIAVRARRAGVTEIPNYLQNPRLQDVTPLYTPTYTVKIPVKNRKEKFVYLCIAKQGAWEAIAGSEIDAQGFATFDNMGGNLLYNVMFYDKGNYKPAGTPFIITHNGQLKMLPTNESKWEKVRLTRVFPVKRADNKWKYNEYFRDARLEGANQADFSDAETLYTIIKPLEKWHTGHLGGPHLRDRLEYESLWKEIIINKQKSYRYIRLIFPEKQFCKVGELQILGATATALSGKAIGSVQHPEWAFDGVPGYSIVDESPQGGHWVGLDLGKTQQINGFRYLPATGEHAIQPGKTYQLFYWNDYWKPLNIIKTDQHYIEFDKVPTETLLWLHCKDCKDVMERPFTYENGKQIWW